MIIIGIIIVVIIACVAWNKDSSSGTAMDREVRESPEFRDIPGNKYYRG